jgi:putative beta-lysine N-acetyltransferase
LENLRLIREQHDLNKTIVYTVRSHLTELISNGYALEGRIDSYFQGEYAYILTRFNSEDRRWSSNTQQNNEIMNQVFHDNKTLHINDLERPYSMELVGPERIPELSSLYRKVFQVYPTNIFDPDYLRKKMGPDYFFMAIKYNQQIISAAAGMLFPKYDCAEITDCVTDPDFRGNNLMARLIVEIEKQLSMKNIHTYFVTARAKSIGMNLTIKRLGYKFEGRLINHCKIYSGYEDLNIWTKSFCV